MKIVLLVLSTLTIHTLSHAHECLSKDRKEKMTVNKIYGTISYKYEAKYKDIKLEDQGGSSRLPRLRGYDSEVPVNYYDLTLDEPESHGYYMASLIRNNDLKWQVPFICDRDGTGQFPDWFF